VQTQSLGIIGAGNMGEAIARSIIHAGVLAPELIVAADPSPERRNLFEQQLHVRAVPDARDAARASTVLLAVKPQQMEQVLREIAPVVLSHGRIISIAAGITTAVLDRFLEPKNSRIVRAMPNTPMLVSAGMVAIAPGPRATDDDVAATRNLFKHAAVVIEVSEDKLDAVTALSGSGPAYFFYLVEQLIRAGEEMGLSAEESRTLAIQTAVGSGRMLESADVSVEELRRRVTSPGGTTEAAITQMQREKLDRIFVDAVKAAQRRGRELEK
jgi:pyrroline-5-carboxylate reductase